MRRARASEPRIRVFEDPRRLSLALAGRFVGDAAPASRERGRFTVALSGGRTPVDFYRVLAAEFRDFVLWPSVHFFWSDERYVPESDPESNVRLARESLLYPLRIPSANIHAPRTDLPDPHQAALDYEGRIQSHFEPEPPRFDWILLGLGRDGHVASLFPGSQTLSERRRLVVAIEDAPIPPPVRLTMTLPLINRAREIHVLVVSEEKREAVSNALCPTGSDIPARHIRPAEGTVQWWLDRAAAGDLP